MRRNYLSQIFNDFEEFYNAFNNTCGASCKNNHLNRVSISEDEEHVYVDAQLPGIPKENIEVTIDPKERKLLICGKNSKSRENVNYHMQMQGNYCYEIPLSNEIDVEGKIDATSKEGILSVALDKNQTQKPMRIDVKLA